ncbi:NUDIX domain-containing protein [Salinicoccus sp. HZC-1]|uniref:NUDIX domain-containing protein n=1 Tax=Salinicoccus sp. HZC-1 TaxID=3385497 RepID=UPI00398B1486
MLEFEDFGGRKVTLEFEENESARHVLVICKFNDQYLMTNHKIRGVEFTGGKVEPDETREGAVHREVFEETGASIADLKYVGYYTVHAEEPFSKAVYYADVEDIFFKCDYLETLGPVLYPSIEAVPEEERSILLEDDCIRYLYDMSVNDTFFNKK